jgi:hypothetical protein
VGARLILAIAVVSFGITAARAAEPPAIPLPRTILALYDSRIEEKPALTRIHQFAEAPLNHLGLTLEYHDVAHGLPSLAGKPDVRGVLTWFSRSLDGPGVAYVRWAKEVVEQKRFFVILGEPGFRMDVASPDEPQLASRFTSRLGFVGSGRYSPGPYGIQVLSSDPAMVEYERRLAGPLPGYHHFRVVGENSRSYLSVRMGDDADSRSDLVVVGERGGMVAAGYVVYTDDWLGHSQWRIDPFAFFRAAYRTDELPKPDPTTLAGRRLFYAHVDGDGWREPTRIPGYEKKLALCAEVIYDVLQRYPAIPVTVAPVAADLDGRWFGNRRAQTIAKRIFSLPNVEAGTHLLSHPFLWEHYHPGSPAGADVDGTAAGGASPPEGTRTPDEMPSSERARQLIELGEAMPPPYRAYPDIPFDLSEEVDGSIRVLNELLAPGKRVSVVKWSGDARPSQEALAAADAAGLPNMNGGANGFFWPYRTLTSVSPVGLRVGGHFQVYAGNANEASYTNRRPDRVPGSYHSTRVMQWTETPRRLRPFEVYWHMYSALHYSSLNGVISQLDMAHKLDLVPVAASTYARIAAGFGTARLSLVGDRAWRIEDRSELDTVRFDNAVFSTVDFARSRGVVGQRHYQGSLYVYLDAADVAPIVALREDPASGAPADGPHPYLVESRWPIRDLVADGANFAFTSKGYDAGDMLWHVPEPGTYDITALGESGSKWRATVTVAKNRLLRMMPPVEVGRGRFRIEKQPAQAADRS